MRQRDRISLAIGGAALLSAVLLMGGALRWTQALVGGLVALALAMQVGSRRRIDKLSPLVVLIAIAIGLTALQLVPLPDRLLDVLNGPGNELRNDGAVLAGTSPLHAISLDPAGTLRALAFFTIVLGVALLGLRIAASERGRYLLLAGVAIVCGLAAAITGIHTLVNAESLYGFYEPQHATPPLLGPLLNANHLGGLMAVGATLAVGLAFYERQAAQLRVLWVVVAIGCTTTALASLSRGATLGLGLGIAATIALLVASRVGTGGDGKSRPRRALFNDIPITIVIAFGLAVAVYTSAGKVADQLDNTALSELNQPLSKYAAWKSSFELVEEAPWVGVGRGALEPTFTRVHDASAYITFSHLENEYIQAIVEWGIPGAAALGLVFAWCIVTAVKRWRDGPLAACAIGACAAILFQSSVDFGIELLGIALPITLVATTLLVVPLRESRSIPIQLARVGMIGGLVAAAAVLVMPATRSLQEDHDWLTFRPDAELDDMRAAMQRHPLDYFAFGETSAFMLRTGDPRAAKFLNHALMLHPTHPGLHRLAARMLIATGRKSQGAVEYALALHGTLTPKNLIVEVVTLIPDPDIAAAAMPLEYDNPELILHALRELGREDISERWLQRLVSVPQRDTQLIDQLFELAMRRHDLPVAEATARRRLAESRTNTSRLMLAKVMFQREKFDQVLKDLSDVAKWKGRIDEQTDAWFLVCDIHIEKRAWDPALQCLHNLDVAGIVTGGRRDGVVKRLALINENRTTEAKLKAIEDMERALGSGSKSP